MHHNVQIWHDYFIIRILPLRPSYRTEQDRPTQSVGDCFPQLVLLGLPPQEQVQVIVDLLHLLDQRPSLLLIDLPSCKTAQKSFSAINEYSPVHHQEHHDRCLNE